MVIHDTTPSSPELEPLTTHRRPRPRKKLVGNIVNQSQETRASQEMRTNQRTRTNQETRADQETSANLQFPDDMNKEQNYVDAGTQYNKPSSSLELSHPKSYTSDSPKQLQQKSSKEAYARVHHQATKIMESCLNLSEPPSFGKLMTILKGIDEMARTQL